VRFRVAKDGTKSSFTAYLDNTHIREEDMIGKKTLMKIALLLAATVLTVGTPRLVYAEQNARAAQAEEEFRAGRYRLAGTFFRRAFAEIGDPLFLKRAGQAYMALGSNGRDDAISAFREYAMNAATPEQGEEAERLLKVAQAIPKAPEPVTPEPPPPTEKEEKVTLEREPPPAPPRPASGKDREPAVPNPYRAATPEAAKPQPPPEPAPAPVPSEPPPAEPRKWEEEPSGYAADKADISAGRFGAGGNFVLAVDRIGAIQSYKIRIVNEESRRQADQTGFDANLLLMNAGQGSDARSLGIFQVSSLPRFSMDVLVADSFSIGGYLGLSNSSAKITIADEQEDLPRMFIVFLGPRMGYAPGIGKGADLWLTAGVGYVYQMMEDGDESLQVSHVMANLEATVVAGVSDGFALGIGAFFDGTLSGQYRVDVSSVDSEESSANNLGMIAGGLKLGLIGWTGRKKQKESRENMP
jgi:hypothetical protein